jgi:hypothetical protein
LRYLAAAIAALLISVPAVAVAGGPDALSVAKRALRLAKQPPEITYVRTEGGAFNQSPRGIRHRIVCPRGTLPVNAFPEFESVVTVNPDKREVRAFQSLLPEEDAAYSSHAGMTVVCIEGRRDGS